MHMNTRKFRRMLSLALLTAMLLASGLSAAETVIALEKTKVYQLPDKDSASMSISAGTTMEVTGEKNGWLRVERDGHTAYMRADDATELIDCGGMAGYAAKSTPMYDGYKDGDKLGTLPEGAEVKVYAMAGEWVYASYSGHKGFVRKEALTTTKPEFEVEEEKKDNEVIVTGGKAAYSKADAKVYKSYSTSSKVLGTLPVNIRLSVEATRGSWAYVTLNGNKGFMLLDDLCDKKQEVEADQTPEAAPQGRAQSMDWWTSDIQDIFSRNTVATFTDVVTGISWQEVRRGGSNHADCQPLTEADTTALKRACGKWSWERRAIIVTIDGVNYAASMNCMAHGGGSISNGFNGHHCIHFTNSRTHGTDIVCPDHQAAIQKALKAKL